MCKIIINSVKGFQSDLGTLTSIIIKGKADDCEEILIFLECSSMSITKTGKVLDGIGFEIQFYSNELSNASCFCGKNIFVRVQCVNSAEECIPAIWEGVLECVTNNGGSGNGGAENKLCKDKSNSLLECKPFEVLDGPQHTMVYHQALAFEKIDVTFPDIIEGGHPIMLACEKIRKGGIEIDLAFDLVFHQDWYFQRIGIEDIISTISLAPGEELKLSMKKSQRKFFEQDTLDSVEKIQSSESTIMDKDVINVARMNSQRENWKVDGNAGIRLGVFNFGASPSYSKTIESKADFSSQKINDSTLKSAKSLKSLTKIEIKEQTEEFSEVSSMRTITNPFNDRTLTIKVFSLAKQYCVKTALFSQNPVLIITLKGLKFNEDFIISNGSFITKFLLDEGLKSELYTALESTINLKASENRNEASKKAGLALHYLFEKKDIFKVDNSLIPNPNDPASSFDASNWNISGLKDSLATGAGMIFTILNFYYKIYIDEIKNKKESKEEEKKTFELEIALSIEKTLKPVWNPEKGTVISDLSGALDNKHQTEILRRLGGFLSMVSDIVIPMINWDKNSKEAEILGQRTELILIRTEKHLNCNSEYYTEKYLKYLADTTSMRTIAQFVKMAIDNSDIKNKKKLFDYFNLVEGFLSGNQVIIPAIPGVKFDDIKNFSKFLVRETETAVNVPPPKTALIEVPFDGIHMEMINGTCPPLVIPPKSAEMVEFNADLKIEAKNTGKDHPQ